MKKILNLFIFTFICLFGISKVNVASINLTTSSDSVNVGDTVDVTITLSNDIAGWEFDLDYDTTMFSIQSSELEATNRSTNLLTNHSGIYKITLKALKRGNSTITLSNVVTIDENANELNSTVSSLSINVYKSTPTITSQGYVQNIGWQNSVTDSSIIGTTGKSLRLEAFKMKIESDTYTGGITYQTYIQGSGWQDSVSDDQMSGTTGQSLRIEMLKIELTGDIANYYDIYYRVHIANIGWTSWTSNGEIAGSLGYNYQIEALQVQVVSKGTTVSGAGTAYYEKPASITYQSHVQNIGWQKVKNNGQTSGTTGKSLRVEALKIYLDTGIYSGNIKYQAHVQNIGWQNAVTNGKISGTTGKSLRVEAIKIWLTGDIANYYDIYYRVHVENIGWTAWTSNGEAAGSAGYSYRMEAIQIKLVKKGSSAPSTTGTAYYEKPASITYQSHIQNIGWQKVKNNGQTSGTTGKSLRVEAIKINLDTGVYSGNIKYQAHVQNIGWQKAVTNGQTSGTTGQSLRVEAIKIWLTGDIKNYYDIYYRVHVQNIGWTAWTSNGNAAGSTGYSYRMEAYQIKLVKKGDKAPSTSGTALYVKPKNIIDVSVHNKTIDWSKVSKSGSVDGTILRIGYGSSAVDSKFEYNLQQVKKLGIPYGVYLFSYAESADEARAEAAWLYKLLKKYDVNPTLGIYYDIENWCIGSYCPNITSDLYDAIIPAFINKLKSYGYNASVYTYLNYTKTNLSTSMQNYITWIAQYNNTCTYTGKYTMWQYSSKGKISGITTNVDLNIMY